jgi:putative Holliday junction resolvase
MITLNIDEFIKSIRFKGKVISVDLGMKQIGIAISNKNQTIVEDYFQFKSAGLDKDILFLSEKYNNDEYTGIIIGLPFSHTRENNWINFIDNFALKLSKSINLPICLVDESYSTQSIKHLIQNFSRKRQKKWKDKLAASCILEQTLCTMNHYRENFNDV